MKLVKKFVLPVLFVSVLAVNTYAGETETPGAPVPPPQHSMSYVPTDETTTVSTEYADETNELSAELIYEAFTAALSLF